MYKYKRPAGLFAHAKTIYFYFVISLLLLLLLYFLLKCLMLVYRVPKMVCSQRLLMTFSMLELRGSKELENLVALVEKYDPLT